MFNTVCFCVWDRRDGHILALRATAWFLWETWLRLSEEALHRPVWQKWIHLWLPVRLDREATGSCEMSILCLITVCWFIIFSLILILEMTINPKLCQWKGASVTYRNLFTSSCHHIAITIEWHCTKSVIFRFPETGYKNFAFPSFWYYTCWNDCSSWVCNYLDFEGHFGSMAKIYLMI